MLIADYVDLRPYVVGEGVEDDQGRSMRFLHFTVQPSDELAIVIGDLIHNVRSALNHLAAACSPRENWRSVQFPIFEEDPSTILDPQRRKSALNAWNRQTTGMTKAARAALKTLQPYYPGLDNKTFHGLSIVEELSNTDKHRELVVTGFGLRDPTITTTINGLKLRSKTVSGDMNDGAKITTEPFPREVKMEIEGTTLVVVSMGEKGGHVELPSALYTVIRACRKCAIPTLLPHVLR
jgi:hypothetical protein